jgi:phospholipid/cholesterol/gamma-HCH transport system substrate-binding protein
MQPGAEITRSLRNVALASRLFLAIAVVSLCAVVALLAYHQGAFTKTIRVYFHAGTAEGMNKGMAVKLVGFKVGSLERITIDSDLRVRVELGIDAKYASMIDADATVRLTKEAIIGANVLEVRPGSGDKGPIKDRVVLRYEREPALESALTALVDQVAPIVADTRNITAYFSNPDSDFRQAIANLNRTAATLAEAGAELRRLIATGADRLERGEAKVSKVLDNADDLLKSANSSLAVLDSSLKKIDAALPGIASKMDQSLENIRVTSEAVRGMATGELPGIVGETGALVSDTGEIVRGARQAWPVRSLVQPRQELLLRLDSGGGLAPVPVESGRAR